MKVLTTVLSIFTVFLIAWFLMSWADIIIDNLSPNPTQHPLNMFGVLLNLLGWL